jgi:hypothetical protein
MARIERAGAAAQIDLGIGGQFQRAELLNLSKSPENCLSASLIVKSCRKFALQRFLEVLELYQSGSPTRDTV